MKLAEKCEPCSLDQQLLQHNHLEQALMSDETLVSTVQPLRGNQQWKA